MRAYKMFNMDANGGLHYLYVNTKAAGLHVGDVVTAQDGGYEIDPKNGRKYVAKKDADGKLKRLAYRPGLHVASLPLNAHIGAKGGDGRLYRRPETVFCEVEFDGRDYSDECIERSLAVAGKVVPRECQLDHLPVGGWYKYKTNINANKDQQWYIVGQLRINRILTEDEVCAICEAEGFTAQPLMLA